MNDLLSKVSMILFVAVFLSIVATGVYRILPRHAQAKALERQHAELQRQIEAKERDIETIRIKQRRLKEDRAFVEALAREHHLVLPGELVFIFEDEKGAPQGRE